MKKQQNKQEVSGVPQPRDVRRARRATPSEVIGTG